MLHADYLSLEAILLNSEHFKCLQVGPIHLHCKCLNVTQNFAKKKKERKNKVRTINNKKCHILKALNIKVRTVSLKKTNCALSQVPKIPTSVFWF